VITKICKNLQHIYAVHAPITTAYDHYIIIKKKLDWELMRNVNMRANVGNI
jgi:hypothetical protein